MKLRVGSNLLLQETFRTGILAGAVVDRASLMGPLSIYSEK